MPLPYIMINPIKKFHKLQEGGGRGGGAKIK